MLVLVSVIGYFLVNNKFPLAPIVLGYILGPIIEKNFRTGVMLSRGSMFGFVESPIAMVIAVVILFLPTITEKMQAKKLAKKA